MPNLSQRPRLSVRRLWNLTHIGFTASSLRYNSHGLSTRFRPSLEALEVREVLSADPLSALSAGTAMIQEFQARNSASPLAGGSDALAFQTTDCDGGSQFELQSTAYKLSLDSSAAAT